MHAAKILVAVTLYLTATLAQAAGFRLIDVPADADGPALKGAMWYPCSAPPGEIHLDPNLGLITLSGVTGCPISGDKVLPLVVVSHGMGGDFTGHHDVAETLADAGFIVAAIDHPGHTTSDMSRSGDLSVFVERPTDIKRLTDFMLGASPATSNIDPEHIGFFGFSAGGYTGLVLIGASPDWAINLCQRSSAAPCASKSSEKGFRVQPLAHDVRIKAAVIADPCSLWFTRESFAAVTVPVQLWTSERQIEWHGMPMPSAESVVAVDRSLPAAHEYHVVPNAGHFAFLFVCPPGLEETVRSACRQGLVSPCPPEPEKNLREVCTDAPGFDRVAFHKQFDADVLSFFRTHLMKDRVDNHP